MKNELVRIAIVGASGRMGNLLIQAVEESEQTTLGAKLNITSTYLDDINFNKLLEIKDRFDIMIDFTYPNASIMHLAFCQKHNKGIVIGTTGFTNDQKKIIRNAARNTKIVFAPNFSIGINVMFRLIEKATKMIGELTDIEILDFHHRYKADAPSGTALAIGEIIAKTLGQDLAKCAVYNHIGHVNKHKEKAINFATVRAGDIIGEHTVIFAGTQERLEITHKASSRKIFANGAVRAAIWLSNQKNGLFDMFDILNLDKI